MSGDEALVDGGSRHEPPKRRHLIDWDNPPPARSDPMSLTRVQRWVMSVLATVTILHFAGGIVLAAVMVDPAHQSSRLPLLILAGVTGVGAVAAGLAIHRHRILSPWLMLGWLPTLVGAWLVYWR